MSRAAKRHQKKVARKAALKRRSPPPRAGARATPAAPADYLSELTRQGLQHHQAGCLQEAETIYRQVLDAKPGHPEANHLLGSLAHDAGEYERAAELISKAIAKAPKQPTYRNSLGNALQALGRPDEAAASYRKAIAVNPDFAEAHNNLANLLVSQGRFDDAAAGYRKALAINPDYAEAHYNLANVLRQSGRADDAILGYEKALALNPGFAAAQINLGNAFLDLGRLEDAVAWYEKALAVDPSYAEAHSNLGSALRLLGRSDDAFAHCRRATSLNPQNDSFWNALAACLESASFATADGALFDDLLHLLDRPSVRSNAVAGPAISALRQHPAFAQVLRLGDPCRSHAEIDFADVAGRLAAIPLFLRVIEQSHIGDLDVERLLTMLRRAMLGAAMAGDASEGALPFSAALTLHCFTNEYVFCETDEERTAVEALERRIAALVKDGSELPVALLAALAAYRPLHRFAWADGLQAGNWPDAIRNVIVRQIAEPAEERSLRSEIPRLTPIDDTVSLAVREQYEQNPYPRWIKVDIENQPRSIPAVLRGSPLHFDLDISAFPDSPEVLVAGCGTGQHALRSASNYLNAHVLAVDLSLSSLGYAARKARELGVSNVEFAQADITELGALGRQFDVIECSGVLHHLGDPMVGWRVLADLLRPGGFMKIGLYSEIARASVVEARALIEGRGYASSAEDIRRCRADIIAMAGDEATGMAALLGSLDFYSLSECRDLIFHVQEHRFTLPQIEAALAELRLDFLGFELRDQGVMRAFEAAHPGAAAATSLASWHEFEQKNPGTFLGMYQFWCRKP